MYIGEMYATHPLYTQCKILTMHHLDLDLCPGDLVHVHDTKSHGGHLCLKLSSCYLKIAHSMHKAVMALTRLDARMHTDWRTFLPLL
jgi:hypothetical protein